MLKKFIFFLLLIVVYSLSLPAQIKFNRGWEDYSKPYWLPIQDMGKKYNSQPQPLTLSNDSLMLLYAACSNPDTIYSVISTDGGFHWSTPNCVCAIQKFSKNGYLNISGIVTNTGRLLISYSLNDISSMPTKILYSDNKGASWSPPANIIGSLLIPEMTFAKSNNGKILILGHSSYMFLSTDNGVSWSNKSTGFPMRSAIFIDNNNIIGFYQVTNSGRVSIYSKKSTDGGNTWGSPSLAADDSLSVSSPRIIEDNAGKLWLFYIVKKATIFNGIYQNDIHYKTSTDLGNSWSEAVQFTKYVGDDDKLNLTLFEDTVYVTFMSKRWYDVKQIWAAKIGMTTDVNPPPTVDLSVAVKENFSLRLRAFCRGSSQLNSVKISYNINHSYSNIVDMYDDGLHNDSLPGDNIYGYVFDILPENCCLSYEYIVADVNGSFVVSKGGMEYFRPVLAPNNNWMAAGSLHNWYSSLGGECEEGRVKEQQDGLRWPGIYNKQDMQVARGMWIGAANFTDENNFFYPYKVIHVGPRVTGEGEFYTTKFKVINKFETPLLFVNNVPDNQYPVGCDSIDPNMKPDRMIINEVNSQLGITVTRKIMQFSHPQHDNYIITDYAFTNTGNTDSDEEIELPNINITALRIFFLNRYAMCKETRYIIGNGTGWGMNTMLDARGDGVRPDTITEHYRTQFGWHGFWPSRIVTYNNIGGPILQANPYSEPGDSVGRLGAAQFVGQLVLHADQSSINHNDDFLQPSTTAYVSSDLQILSGNNPYNIEQMTEEYELMSIGHSSPRHAWVVQPSGDFALQTYPPEMGTSGGFSACNGFGPYALAHGESINLVLVDGAAGLSREECIRIGKAYKNGSIDDVAKNRLVLTGKDSLMKTWKMVTENYQSGYNLPSVPLPPKEFYVTCLDTSISLTWQLFDNSNPADTYRIYRRMWKADSTFIMIYEGPSGVLSYNDAQLVKGEQYYYYIVAVNASGVTSNPNYTCTHTVVQTVQGVENNKVKINSYSLLPNYPNPFNPVTNIRYHLPSGSNVKLTVYNSLGQKVKELVNSYKEAGSYEVKFSGKDLASGMYIYKLDAVSKDGKKNFSSSRKMLLVK